MLEFFRFVFVHKVKFNMVPSKNNNFVSIKFFFKGNKIKIFDRNKKYNLYINIVYLIIVYSYKIIIDPNKPVADINSSKMLLVIVQCLPYFLLIRLNHRHLCNERN